jgi:hypothetical protein
MQQSAIVGEGKFPGKMRIKKRLFLMPFRDICGRLSLQMCCGPIRNLLIGSEEQKDR